MARSTEVGDIWRSKDPRDHGRTVKVEGVQRSVGTFLGGRLLYNVYLANTETGRRSTVTARTLFAKYEFVRNDAG